MHWSTAKPIIINPLVKVRSMFPMAPVPHTNVYSANCCNTFCTQRSDWWWMSARAGRSLHAGDCKLWTRCQGWRNEHCNSWHSQLSWCFLCRAWLGGIYNISWARSSWEIRIKICNFILANIIITLVAPSYSILSSSFRRAEKLLLDHHHLGHHHPHYLGLLNQLSPALYSLLTPVFHCCCTELGSVVAHFAETRQPCNQAGTITINF